jgi:hypothetical protein
VFLAEVSLSLYYRAADKNSFSDVHRKNSVSNSKGGADI